MIKEMINHYRFISDIIKKVVMNNCFKYTVDHFIGKVEGRC